MANLRQRVLKRAEQLGMGWTLPTIRKAHKKAGGHWFDKAAIRFFRSEIQNRVRDTEHGIYFVSSEQFVSSLGEAQPRRWSVRIFNPDTKSIDTVGGFPGFETSREANRAATRYSHGHPHPERCYCVRCTGEGDSA